MEMEDGKDVGLRADSFRVFLAAPLRRQVIVKEKLVFPSGSR